MEPEQHQRPVPSPCWTTGPFWEAARNRQLVLQYDPVAERYQFWPRPASVATGKSDLQWRPASGKGQLYSYTIAMMPAAGFEGRGQYLVGLIELDEGVRMIANLIGIDSSTVRIGMRVKVAWETLTPEINFPAFEPDD